MKKVVSSIIYYSWIIVLLYSCLLQSRRARNRYSSRDLLTKSGRDNSDEGLNYFVFEKIYLQVPLLFLQLLCQFLFPKRCRFDFMALGSIFILAVLVQFRTIILIASWSLVFFLFQAEEKLIRAIAALLSISFTGYLKSGFKIRRFFFEAERNGGAVFRKKDGAERKFPSEI
ncbi:unnamed protein product [Oikopleura dioica]|uniref:Uncharacterized protein n=1 Tax=Oikopleura dioica TaxID=34765 RepID=E4YM32_OIKDI|nr:unnamed protein product [Oikopleura dioica]